MADVNNRFTALFATLEHHFAWKSLINYCMWFFIWTTRGQTTFTQIRGNFETYQQCHHGWWPVASKPIKSEDIKPLYLTLFMLPSPSHPVCSSPLSLLPPSMPSAPLGRGSSSGWGSALGVWGRVCLSKWRTVLPLQGPLGAAPGYTHLGEHQVCAEGHENRRNDELKAGSMEVMIECVDTGCWGWPEILFCVKLISEKLLSCNVSLISRSVDCLPSVIDYVKQVPQVHGVVDFCFVFLIIILQTSEIIRNDFRLCVFPGRLVVHRVAVGTGWSSARNSCWCLEVSMRAPGRPKVAEDNQGHRVWDGVDMGREHVWLHHYFRHNYNGWREAASSMSFSF